MPRSTEAETRLRSTRREPAATPSRRLPDLSDSFSDRDFRASYTAHHLRAFLADQFCGLRGDASQKEFGAWIGKPQSVVSRLENEDCGKVLLQTLIDVAARLDIGLVVRLSIFQRFFGRRLILPRMPWFRLRMIPRWWICLPG
jgi:hypothetical protein